MRVLDVFGSGLVATVPRDWRGAPADDLRFRFVVKDLIHSDPSH
jgi:hypothetical protein